MNTTGTVVTGEGAMSLIIIASVPAHGHVAPLLTVAENFVQRGDHVPVHHWRALRRQGRRDGGDARSPARRGRLRRVASWTAFPSGDASRASRRSLSTSSTSSPGRPRLSTRDHRDAGSPPR